MKKIKWSFLIVFLFLICACNRDNEPIVENYGIKDYSVVDSEVLYVNNSYYTKENGQKIDVYGYDGKLYFSYDQELEHILHDSKYIYRYRDELVNEIYDLQGNLIMQGKISAVYSDYVEGYIIKDNYLLNENHEIVYSSQDLISDKSISYFIYKDHLFTFGLKTNKMINLKTNHEIVFEDYFIHRDYVVIIKDGKHDLYKLTNDEFIDTFDSVDFGEYYGNLGSFDETNNLILIKGNQKKYLVGNRYTDKYEYTLDNNYVLDFSACTIGAQLKDKKGNTVISECLNDYQFKGDMIAGYLGYSGLSKVYKDSKEISVENKFYYFIDDYLVEEDEVSSVIYDLEGKVVGDYYLVDIPKGYVGRKDDKYYFLDEQLNPISKEYKSISCSYNNYCVVRNETGYYALFHDLKEITPFEYLDIYMSDSYIELDDVSQKIILHLEKGNNNFEFPKTTKSYLDIEINDQVQLDKNTINNNLEFIKKFVYVLENNTKLGKFKPYVYDILQVVLDNKDCMNEPYFLQRLKTLNIVEDKNIVNAGEYYSGINKININDESESTIYHELMHFLDYSMNDYFYISLWEYQGKIISNVEYYVLSSTEKEKCTSISIPDYDANILVEGGAELMTAKYFTKGIVAYTEATSFLTGIEHIIGSDAFNDMFFSNQSNYLMLKLFLDSGFTYEQFSEIHNKFLNVALSLSYNFELRIQAVDVLIDLYKANVSHEWYSDSNFVYILKAVGGIGYNDYSSSKYADYLDGILFEDFDAYVDYENELLKDIDVEVNRIPIPVFIVDNELYLGCSGYYIKEDQVVYGFVYFYYDFVTGKMIDYYFIEE